MVRALAGGVRCPAKEWPAKHKRGLRSFCHTQASNTPPGAQRAHLRLHSTVMYTHSRHYTTPQHTDPQHSSTYNTTQSHHTYTPTLYPTPRHIETAANALPLPVFAFSPGCCGREGRLAQDAGVGGTWALAGVLTSPSLCGNSDNAYGGPCQGSSHRNEHPPGSRTRQLGGHGTAAAL